MNKVRRHNTKEIQDKPGHNNNPRVRQIGRHHFRARDHVEAEDLLKDPYVARVQQRLEGSFGKGSCEPRSNWQRSIMLHGNDPVQLLDL